MTGAMGGRLGLVGRDEMTLVSSRTDDDTSRLVSDERRRSSRFGRTMTFVISDGRRRRRGWATRGRRDETSKTSVMLVSIVLVSTTLVGADHTEGGRTLRRRDERRARLGFLRWGDLEMGRRDEHLVSSRLVFSVGRVDTRAGAMHPAGLVGNRGARGSGSTRTRRGCGFHGCGCGVGPPDPTHTHGMPYQLLYNLNQTDPLAGGQFFAALSLVWQAA
jgi:hypothetical protein